MYDIKNNVYLRVFRSCVQVADSAVKNGTKTTKCQ